MTILPSTRRLFAVLALSTGALQAQTAATGSTSGTADASPKQHHHAPRPAVASGPNLDVVVLDPGHGRQDLGARLGRDLYAKEVNLAFAQRLRSALTARGFTVVLTRESDPVSPAVSPNPDPNQPAPAAPNVTPLTPESRAEVANRVHPLACLLLDSTVSGRGVHLYTSSLSPAALPMATQDAPKPIQLWDTAQAAYLPQSQRLLADVSLALRNLDLPVLSGSASVAPLDAVSCAAIALEIAPTPAGRSGLTQPVDTTYQDRLSHALAEALDTYRAEAAASRPRPTQPAAPPAAIAPAPKPKPKAHPAPTPAAPELAPGASPE